MRIDTLEAERGHKTFGFLEPVETHGRFAVRLPLHIVAGADDGPTLLVQAGVSGLEIEPAMALPQLVAELDPSQLRGTLLLVPLLNTSGFEFEQHAAIWDGKDLNALGRGRADGTVSEQLIDAYYRDVVGAADALLEIRTGSQWGYFRYAGLYDGPAAAESQALAEALGLPQVLLGQTPDATIACAAANDGKTVVSAWIGGGPGLRDYREDDLGRVRRAVLNALRQLGMLPGAVEREQPARTVRLHTVITTNGERGLTFMDLGKRGEHIGAGERIGYVRHPFTGETVREITATRPGVLLHAGAAWPLVPEDMVLAILGDPVD